MFQCQPFMYGGIYFFGKILRLNPVKTFLKIPRRCDFLSGKFFKSVGLKVIFSKFFYVPITYVC
jgi:hypothetical protein